MKNNHAPTTESLDCQIGPIAMLLTAITSIIGSGWLFASLYAAQIAGPAAVFSWLGNYGNGLSVLTHGLDLLLIVVLSLVTFRLAVKLRLPDAETQRLFDTSE